MTREEWLKLLADALKPDVEACVREHVTIEPLSYRVTCGFPSRRALSSLKPRIGECWAADATEDHAVEILISPRLSDPMEIAATLAHELIHALLPKGTKHKSPFGKVAKALGLDGKPTSTFAGPAFVARFGPVLQSHIETYGAYPHGKLTPPSQEPKQKTYLLKVTCPQCGYVARVTQIWLDKGAPICPTDTIPMEA